MKKIVVWKIVLQSWFYTFLALFSFIVIIGVISVISMKFLGPQQSLGIVIFAFFMMLIVFIFSELIVILLMGAKQINKKSNEYKDFYNVVDGLRRKKRMWKCPRLYVLKSLDSPNAMAFGWGILWQYAIGISPSLYQKLTYEELEAVLAHELAHIRCKDVGIFTCIGILTSGVKKLKRVLLSGKTALGRGPFAFIFAGILWFLSEVVFRFLQSAISQERELAADALGASYVGSPEPLISALNKLVVSSEEKESLFQDLFISHPKMAERIKSLQKLGDVQ
jgi:heat shock protein HtpX